MIAGLLAATAVAPMSGRSAKRGVSENSFSLGTMMEALEPGVGWYYNWAGTPGKGYENQVIDFEGMEFVPMCWNASYDAEAIREYCRTHPQTRYLLGFNEPNFTKQANMTPAEAAAEWPAVQALARELGLKLVAPALNYSPNPPYEDPLKWMDEFVAIVGNDAFDYTAIHNYGGLGVMKTLAGAFHDRYGKEVWVTEFCYWPNEGDPNSYVSQANQISSMTETVEWLERTPWIFRYAWFKGIGNYDSSKGPNYGLITPTGGGLDPWALTPQGEVYVGMWDFDTTLWNTTEEPVAAADYIEASQAGLGASCHAGCPSMLEISKFSGGAWAQWQFDVPRAGEYVMTMRLSGYGEPVRFDPQLQWSIVSEGEEGAGGVTPLGESFSPQLPGSDEIYTDYDVRMTLPSGHVTLRLTDIAPYSPSGIKISTLTLGDMSGVDSVSSDAGGMVDVVSLQGVTLRRGVASGTALDGLPAGIYIVGGRKVMKSR